MILILPLHLLFYTLPSVTPSHLLCHSAIMLSPPTHSKPWRFGAICFWNGRLGRPMTAIYFQLGIIPDPAPKRQLGQHPRVVRGGVPLVIQI
ncbi:hypothetical protein B0J17DRAFT_661975 [Rhizoctonia solani]|nr:hypothetical protein B0J17DRAFT_661975 [Rhizoctonia solani]